MNVEEPVVRKVVRFAEEIRVAAGRAAPHPLRRAWAAAVVSNPYAGRYVEDLSPLIRWSQSLGHELGALVVLTLGAPVESYGKAGIVGLGGEQEHANALVTTTFAEGFRHAVGGGRAWISSTTKVGGPGTVIDVPLAHKNALYVRSHYDSMEVRVPEAPMPDEIVIIVAVSSGARLNARVGGLSAAAIRGEDGLR